MNPHIIFILLPSNKWFVIFVYTHIYLPHWIAVAFCIRLDVLILKLITLIPFIQFLGPEACHVISVQLLCADHAACDMSVATMQQYMKSMMLSSLCYLMPWPKHVILLLSSLILTRLLLIILIRMHLPLAPLLTPLLDLIPRHAIESFVDANFPGGIFEKIPPYLGFTVSMSGTVAICKIHHHLLDQIW
jgi:hypothetical protein